MPYNSSYLFTLLFVVIFLYSCQSNKKANNVQSYDVECELVCDEEYILGKPNQIAYSGSVLAVIDRGSDSLMHFFDTVKSCFINKAGRIGQGPNEFTTISSLSPYDDGFGMYDPNLKKYYKVSYTNDTVKIESLFKVDSLMPLNIHPISNNRYISTGIFKGSKFCLIGSDGKIISRIEEWPYRDENEKKVSNHIKAQAYMSNILVNPSKDRFVSYSATADILSFYKVKTDSLELVHEHINSYPDYDYFNNPKSFRGTFKKSPFAYLSSSCTDRYAFILYSGKSTHEYNDKAFRGNVINVYTWDGDKIAELKSDKELNTFCISPDGNIIYAIAYTPEPTLVKINIPQFT